MNVEHLLTGVKDLSKTTENLIESVKLLNMRLSILEEHRRDLERRIIKLKKSNKGVWRWIGFRREGEK